MRVLAQNLNMAAEIIAKNTEFRDSEMVANAITHWDYGNYLCQSQYWIDNESRCMYKIVNVKVEKCINIDCSETALFERIAAVGSDGKYFHGRTWLIGQNEVMFRYLYKNGLNLTDE